MIRCLIVDDEKPAREELKYLLEKYDEIEVIGTAKHGLEAIELNSSLKPDLIFLDIQMPIVNGIEVAQEVSKSDNIPFIVFITAYDEFAIKAFELNAVDYLLKPVSAERLSKSIEKIVSRLNSDTSEYEKRLNKILDLLKTKEEYNLSRICVYNKGSLVPIDADEIIYVTVENKNTIIVSTKGRFDYPNTLSHLEERLRGLNFFRSHRSFIINLDYIEEIEPWFNSTYQIKMKNVNEKVPVSRSQVKEFKKIMDIL